MIKTLKVTYFLLEEVRVNIFSFDFSDDEFIHVISGHTLIK